MRRAALLLALAACDGKDSLGQLGVTVDGNYHETHQAVLSTAASQHRPHGLYIYAEFPSATLEIDIDEGGAPDPERVIYRELDDKGAETYRSKNVTGQVTLLGPPKERRGEISLVFDDGNHQQRNVIGSFAPTGTALPAPPDPNNPNDNNSSSVSDAIDTGCGAASDAADSEGCDGSSSDTSSSGCDGSSGGSASGCDSGGGASGCSGDAGGGCSGSAHAATIHHMRAHKPNPVRIISWLLPYALVGVFIRAWKRRLSR